MEEETQQKAEAKPLESATGFSEQDLVDLMLKFDGAVWNTRGGEAKFLWLENVVVLPKDLYLDCKGFKTKVRYPTMSKVMEFEIVMVNNKVVVGSVGVETAEGITHLQIIPLSVFVALRAMVRAGESGQ